MSTTVQKFGKDLGVSLASAITDHLVEFYKDEDFQKLVGSSLGENGEGSNTKKLVDQVSEIFRNSGYTGSGDFVPLRDLLTSNEAKDLIPQVITNIVTGSADPAMVLNPFFKRIRIAPGQVISFPSIGSIPDAQDIGEAEEYPTIDKLRMKGTITTKVGKVGLKVLWTDEFQRIDAVSQFSLMSLLMNEVGKALGRTRERKAAGLLLRLGDVAFNNLDSSSRKTTGRDPSGTLNGTLTPDDIHRVYAEMITDGFNPDVMFIHPLASLMFMHDDMLRYFTMQNGNKPLNGIDQLPKGQDGFSAFNQAGIDPLQQMHDPNTPISQQYTNPFEQTLLFGMSPVISPFLTWRPTTGVIPEYVDIIIADSSKVGFLIEEDGPKTNEWMDPERDIQNFKVHERYQYATQLQGRAIRIIRGVAVGRRSISILDRLRYTNDIGSSILSSLTEYSTGTVYS